MRKTEEGFRDFKRDYAGFPNGYMIIIEKDWEMENSVAGCCLTL